MLAGGEKIARHREMRVLGRGGDVDRIDVVPFDKLLVVRDRGRRAGLARHFLKPLRPDFGQVQALDQWMRGAGLGADSAAPARANDCHADLLHNVCFLPPTIIREAACAR